MNREEARKRAKALVDQMTMEEAASQLSYQAPAIERLGVPAYNWWNEALHGVARAGMATMFPQAIGMAATFDTALVEELGDVASTEGRAGGQIRTAACAGAGGESRAETGGVPGKFGQAVVRFSFAGRQAAGEHCERRSAGDPRCGEERPRCGPDRGAFRRHGDRHPPPR